MAETVDVIQNAITSGSFTQHVVVNVAKLVNMQTDAKMRESVQACDLINIDGMGVVLAARLLGHQIPERDAGIDLFYELIPMRRRCQFTVFLLGSTTSSIPDTSELTKTHPSSPHSSSFSPCFFFI